MAPSAIVPDRHRANVQAAMAGPDLPRLCSPRPTLALDEMSLVPVPYLKLQRREDHFDPFWQVEDYRADCRHDSAQAIEIISTEAWSDEQGNLTLSKYSSQPFQFQVLPPNGTQSS